ncbi:hypothetical protein DPMN_091125, partial [Dreissena polymorpha]
MQCPCCWSIGGNSLSSLPNDAFRGLQNLQSLYLHDNRLGNIPRAAFSGLTQLQTLYLSRNVIESIDAGVFEGVPNITKLKLDGNQIRNISRAAFGDLSHLEELDLTNNPLNCDCQLRWLIERMQGSQFTLKVKSAVCSEPAHLKGRNIASVNPMALNCGTQINDFNECAFDPCKNGATCSNFQYVFSCTCLPGWKGYNCDQDINECDLAPCKNGANCTNLQNAYSCTCSPGWQGTNCDQ